MKLKIGITCYPSVGGSGVIATELGKLLAERGHEVHFITSSIPFRLNRWMPNIYFHQVQVNQYSVFKYPPYDLSLASKMAEVAKREKLDLLHVHYAIPHAVCAFLAKQMVGDHLKVVTTLHGTDITVLGYDPSLSEMIRFGIESSDKVTAVSNHLAFQTQELLETGSQIETVYNFVDEQVFYNRNNLQLRNHLNIKDEQKVIVHISNFRKVKRVPDIIDVFKKVRTDVDAKLVLIGDGPELTVIRKMVKEYELCDYVLFLGNQENVADILSISDVKLLLSEKESFGLVLLEAMACGVPCVGTRAGGIPEVIENGKTGFVCDIGDIDLISNKVIQLLTNEALHNKMVQEAIIQAEIKFSSKKIVEQYEKIYYETIETSKARVEG